MSGYETIQCDVLCCIHVLSEMSYFPLLISLSCSSSLLSERTGIMEDTKFILAYLLGKAY